MAPAYRTGSAGTGVTTGNPTAVITPAVGDHFVVFVVESSSSGAGTVSDNNGGTYTLAKSAGISATPTTILCVYVRDQALANTTSTTITYTGAGTGGQVVVHATSGMLTFGTASIRQNASLQLQALSTTPAPTFTNAALTTSVVFGAVGNLTNPATVTPPSSFTERKDVGVTTPIGLETVSIDNGFTGTTVTWGSTSPSKYAVIVLELLASQAYVIPLSESWSWTEGTLAIGVGVSASESLALSESIGTVQALNVSLADGYAASVVKTAADGWGTGGASSVQTIAGDGFVSATAPIATTYTIFGLSHTDPNQSYTNIAYGFYVSNHIIGVYENGVSKFGVDNGDSSHVANPGDALAVRRTGTTITYEQNGVVLYTSLTASSNSLLVDTALYQNTSSISNIRLSDNGTNVALNWQNVVGVSIPTQGWLESLQIGVGVSESESWSTYTEAVATHAAFLAGLSESLSLSDALTASYGTAAPLSEAWGSWLESIAILLTRVAGVSDSLSLSEAIAVAQALLAGVAESESISESLTAQLGAFIALVESVSISDSLGVLLTRVASVSESMSLVEFIATARSLETPNFWGPHFPRHNWGPHFPWPRARLVAYGPPGPHGTVTPTSPDGIPLVLALQAGAVATQSFGTEIRKGKSGKEYRVSRLSSPQLAIKGTALVVGGDARMTRGQLARYAARASIFQLGLPQESISVAAATSTEAVPVGSTAFLDWANPGQRCFARGADGTILALVLQSADASTLYFDIPLGALGLPSTVVMPTIPVYLEPTQDFGRYTPGEPVESWQIAARSIEFGTQSVAVAAVLALSTVSTSGVLKNIAVVDNTPGSAGNAWTVQFQHATLSPGVNLTIGENGTAKTVLVQFRAGHATVQQLLDDYACTNTSLDAGAYNQDDVLSMGLDEFGPTALAGGLDAGVIMPGRGATITTYDSRPVYDRGLQVSDTAKDSLQALTELTDLGAVPFNVGDTTIADWGRQAMMMSSRPADRQWLKLFLATVRGCQRAFWLPSWRADLIPTAVGAGSAAIAATLPLAVAASGGSGVLAGLTLTAVPAGSGGNLYRVSFTPDGTVSTGSYSEAAVDGGPRFVYVKFVPGVTTLANLVSLLAAHTDLVTLGGSYTGSATIAASDVFVNVALWGGVDTIGATLTIGYDAAAGDFPAWWPQRDRLQIRQADGTITYAQIQSVSGVGVLNLDAALSASPVTLVSWLELVRFESDDVAITYTGAQFSLNQQARVVQQ